MTKQILNVFGWTLVAIGIFGLFLDDALLGVRLNLGHEIIHLVAGGFALWFARGSVRAARNCAMTNGALFGLLALAGIFFGQPEATPVWLTGTEPSLLKIIPGALEFGVADHVLHLVYSGIFFVAAFKTQPMEVRTRTEMRRALS